MSAFGDTARESEPSPAVARQAPIEILVVTGDKVVASAIKRASRSIELSVASTGDWVRAFRLVSAGTPAALVLDGDLLPVESMALCSRLRSAEITTPVLMLIHGNDPRDRVAALNSGADDCLCKPFSTAELLARVRALVRRDRVVRSSKLAVGDLVVDTAARTVMRGGREIALTQREFTLLEALARHEAQVVERSEIQERVWGDGYSSSNTVDVHIRSLRKKIDAGYRRKLIHTVFGRGYMLKAPPYEE
jgi:DNA-binding response OmpR family regulator